MGVKPHGGCGALEDLTESVAEGAWNGGPERVRVPYAKSEYSHWSDSRVGRDTRNPG